MSKIATGTRVRRPSGFLYLETFVWPSSVPAWQEKGTLILEGRVNHAVNRNYYHPVNSFTLFQLLIYVLESFIITLSIIDTHSRAWKVKCAERRFRVLRNWSSEIQCVVLLSRNSIKELSRQGEEKGYPSPVL